MKLSDREHRRIHLTFYLRVFREKDFIGFCLEISPKGLMVISETPLDTDKSYNLRMRTPPDSGAGSIGGFIEFTALCKWTKPDETNPSFHLNGFEITGLDEELNRSIHRLIKDYRLP